jgi:alpha-N-acetylglucosaminidase
VWDKFGDAATFFGKPFIWCTLLVYGGRQGLYGNLNAVYDGYGKALSQNTTLSGVGITMEGIWTNYPMFEATLLLAWEQDMATASTTEYWTKFADRRYGQTTPGTSRAWALLGSTIYAGSLSLLC